MTTVTFDTLKYANTLEAVGVPRAQAEAQAGVLSEALEVNLKELATKGDIAVLRQEIATKADLRELEMATKADLRELELRMTIKLGGMLVVAVGVIAALIKL